MLCPALRIKGHNALPFQAVVPSTGNRNGRIISLPRQHTLSTMSEAQIQATGMQYVGMIENRIDTLYTAIALPKGMGEQKILYAMWKSLRERDWQWATV
jgi:hypothetical protein